MFSRLNFYFYAELSAQAAGSKSRLEIGLSVARRERFIGGTAGDFYALARKATAKLAVIVAASVRPPVARRGSEFIWA